MHYWADTIRVWIKKKCLTMAQERITELKKKKRKISKAVSKGSNLERI